MVYESLDDLREHGVQEPWDQVFAYYESVELAKWIHMHGEAAAKDHFDKVRKDFERYQWVTGQTHIAALLPVHMCPRTPWISELACPNHAQDNCVNCSDLNPTLDQVADYFPTSFSVNPDGVRVHDMQAELQSNSITPTVLVVHDPTIFQHRFLHDGNHVAIALASDQQLAQRDIIVHFGWVD